MYEFQSQTSVRFDKGGGGGGGIPPPDPPPGTAIVKMNERIGISVGHLVENDKNAAVKSVKAIHKKTYKTDLKPNRHFLTLCGYIFTLSIFAS